MTFALDESIEEGEQILRLMDTLASDDTEELQLQAAPDEVRPAPHQPATNKMPNNKLDGRRSQRPVNNVS